MLWYALPLQCDGAPPQAYQEIKIVYAGCIKTPKQCVSQCAAILYRMASKWVVSALVACTSDACSADLVNNWIEVLNLWLL